MTDPGRPAWRKSSYSGNGGDCVEVGTPAADHGVVLVRDSKDPAGPSLSFTPAEWADFLGGTRAGAFDPS